MHSAAAAPLRLALISLVAAASGLPAAVELCGSIMDRATELAGGATGPEVEAAIGAPLTPAVRFAVASALGEVCGGCKACPRGLGIEAEVMLKAPPRAV